ncbi:MAG TPA: SDR family oxidoreductase [Cyclobacteriaceae bacterium]|nr:SDR family oxidoreductase [Cyclobacteriaceae bacterium]HRJ83507.1 SDR family oxidoreductase [Cyclobacteriaceae bacterium]
MKTVLILGASSEVALALANQLAAKSCELILAARNSDRLAAVKSDLAIRFGINVTLAEFDALRPDTHKNFYESLEPKPDTAICVFGYLGDHTKAMVDWQESATIVMSNYVGAVSILNVIANDFENRKEGMIVGISSVAGERGRQSNYVYGSAKAGFTAYLSGLRNRLFKSGVRVITVKPGFMKTRMLAGMKTSAFLTAQPERAAALIIRAMQRKKDVVYVLPVWKWIMLIIRNIPEFTFKKLKL